MWPLGTLPTTTDEIGGTPAACTCLLIQTSNALFYSKHLVASCYRKYLTDSAVL